VRQIVSLESSVPLVTRIVFGSLAALVTLLPYSIARTGSQLPDPTIAIYLGVVGGDGRCHGGRQPRPGRPSLSRLGRGGGRGVTAYGYA
jgi:hypothetical protein